MGVQSYLWMLLVVVATVWANTNVLPTQIPYEIYPSRSGWHDLDVQPFQEEDDVLTPDPVQATTPEENDPQLQQEELEGAPLVSSEEENLQSNLDPPTTENGPLLPDDIQNFLEEKEELLKQIKLLEEANRNLKLAGNRAVGEENNGTYNHGDVINTQDNLNGKIVTKRPVDCADHLVLGATRSGVYDIYPFTCLCSKPVLVYCDMETDGGGWTVLLTREDKGIPHVNFNRSWSEYKAGFGDVAGEHWIGNEILHTMISSREYTLRMDLKVSSNDFKSALWNTITVDNEVNRYKLTLGEYSAESTTNSNCLNRASGAPFTTFDRDYGSLQGGKCGLLYGGFWHFYCNINVITPTANYSTGLVSNCYNKQNIPASFVQLKIRPVICGSAFKAVYLNSFDCDSCH